MSVQENNEIAEPTSSEGSPEHNVPEIVPALETVTEALTLALENIAIAANAPTTEPVVAEPEHIPEPAVVTANEQVHENVAEQVAAVTETVMAANEVVQEQVAAVVETVVVANELAQEQVAEQVMGTLAAAHDLLEEKKECAADKISVMIKEIGALAKDAENVLDNIKGLNDGSATRSLAELLVAALNPEGPVKDLKIVISKDAHSIISTIAESRPAILDNIKKSLVEVTRDHKVNTNDIPQFISTVKTLYDFVCGLNKFADDVHSTAAMCETVLKIVSHFLILDDQICCDNMEQTLLLTQIDDLINSCVGLLIPLHTIKLTGCFFSFLCR